MESVNMVNAPVIAKERNIKVTEIKNETSEDYHTLIRLTVATEKGDRSIAGTLFGGGKPRIVEINNVPIEAELGAHMLYVVNQDKPGFIGSLGTTLGEAKINIATLHLGRTAPGGNATVLIQVDEPVTEAVLAKVKAIPQVVQVRTLRF
jgi:D-3-phosphoglycerate dehydrogenase